MIKYKILKRILTSGIAIVGIITLVRVNVEKANADGWVKINNSWRYYSGTSAQSGWSYNNGAWYYLDENGLAKTGWIKSEGRFYYLDPNTGKMLTGWIQDEGNWYYLNSSGEMVTGWLEYNGNLYYLNTSGVMVKDIYIGSYYLGPDGAWREDRNHNR